MVRFHAKNPGELSRQRKRRVLAETPLAFASLLTCSCQEKHPPTGPIPKLRNEETEERGDQRKRPAHQGQKGGTSLLLPPARPHRSCLPIERSGFLLGCSVMTGPAEEAPAAASPPAPASPPDSITEEAPAARSRGFWLLGEDKSVHRALGGGKTADVLLWKDKKTSAAVVGGATILWVLFEVVEYHLLTLVSHVLIVALTILFLWANATVFINKSPPNVPEVQISEELAVNIALRLRADINKALGLLREIAMGHDLMKFLGVIVALWILSEVGELCDLLRLMYIGNGSLSSENSVLVIL
ncbi:reticulon-like protein B2 isoform X2 [Panicum virgatum]|uniref:reticulon-like protein B2 isoform X2 n=1 Tax=Panicum virgatum TaxID=38727 RepID=UPI0019D53F02|nr:reticulon-like protein B2 isoform X2 [Panicum virgatum]